MAAEQFEGPTEHEQAWINKIVQQVWLSLVAGEVPASVAASAMMILAASAAAHACPQSQENDEYVIEQFRHCLLDARTRGDTQQ